MDNEEDSIYYSHEKLKGFIETSNNADGAVQKYLSQVKYLHMGDFMPGLEWFNVSEPLSLSNHLKGKIVVLDFFTYCCINCMHILPDLKKLENEFSVEDGLVVVGVHSAKFKNEKDSANILSAVQRYNISHPVVNDKTNDMWNKYDINCWPTLLVMDPNAKPLIMFMGEGKYDDLHLLIKNALQHYKTSISQHKLPIKSAFHLLPELKGPLLFPGKIAMFSDGDRDMLAISDTGNNRILLAVNGIIIQKIGGSKDGFKDGNFDRAEFNQPQGLVFQNSHTIFVADTENHVIRKIKIDEKEVVTVAGTGKQFDDRIGGKIGREQGISSPWDLCIYSENGKDVLIIAMAGTHQIWAMFLDDTVWWKNKIYKAGTVVCIAGNGREENRNNQYPNNAAFAQPSGLALCRKNKEIYIADSESSSVRRLSLIDGKVTAVVGGDRDPQNLFAFGDRDGKMYDAKLQHSLGLSLSKDENILYVADTYNHKIKSIDISKNFIRTLNPPGDSVDSATRTFNEPAGLCTSSDGSKLYLADTNNHTIKILHLNKGDDIDHIEVLDLKFDDALIKREDKINMQILMSDVSKVNTEGGKVILNINIVLIDKLKLTVGAPQKWSVDCSNPKWSSVPSGGIDISNVETVVSLSKGDKRGNIDIVFNLMTCTKDYCYPKKFLIRQPIEYYVDGRLSLNKEICVKLGVDSALLS